MVSPKNQNHKKRNTCMATIVKQGVFSKSKKGHLFIDNVERENTETVELLLSSGSAHRVKGAAVKIYHHSLKISGQQILSCLVTVGKTVHIGFGKSLLATWSWLRYLIT